MNSSIITPLLTNKLGREASDRVLQHVLAAPDLFPELLEAFFGRDLDRVNMAAMTIGNLARQKPAWLQPHQHRFYEVSINPIHPGIRRNAMRYLSELPVLLEDDHTVPKWVRKKDFLYLHRSKQYAGKQAWLEPELEGPVFDLSLELIRNVNATTAPRAFAMLAAKNLCLKYPELAVELSGTIYEFRDTGTPGFNHMARKHQDVLSRLLEHYGL